MSRLKHLEICFQDFLLNSLTDISKHLVGTNSLSVERRLQIYHNDYQSRLHNTLAKNFPMLARYLGSNQFSELTQSYVFSHPSHHRSIRWFGDLLPEFLSAHSPYHQFPYLCELATLEWKMGLVQDAADVKVLDIDLIKMLTSDEWSLVSLNLHPSTQRLTLKWNVVAIWHDLFDEKVPPLAQQQTQSSEWLIWKNYDKSHFTQLTELEAWAIDRVLMGATIADLCTGFTRWFDEEQAGVTLGALLKSWFEAGFIVSNESISLENAPTQLV